MSKKVLFISGSIGLGHVTRDLAIAKKLQQQEPEVEISWLAASPASQLIKEAGERLLPEADLYANENIPAENAAEQGFRLNLLKYLMKAKNEWEHNINLFAQLVSKESFDLVIADEAYEIKIALGEGKVHYDGAFVMIYDFIGQLPMSWNPMERLVTFLWNLRWAKFGEFFDNQKKIALFIGEPEDIPDSRLGFLLPNRRKLAVEACQFVGYVFPFDPTEYANKSAVRAKLGYGPEPLLVCSVGGTSAGKELLDLCVRAFPIVREQIPNLRMVLICGPRIAPQSVEAPEGIEVKGYVPTLYEHLAACDLAIVQAGNTTTLELTALKRPFLYFPLEGHFEQEVYVSQRLQRHRAGTRMLYSQTRPASLAEKIIDHMGKDAEWQDIPVDGAQKAAQIIGQLL